MAEEKRNTKKIRCDFWAVLTSAGTSITMAKFHEKFEEQFEYGQKQITSTKNWENQHQS
jgi:hypothetical protein